LVNHLRHESIHLEVCPTSNIQTGVCRSYGEHPVDKLFREGISLGISTDTRTITNVTLEQEYARLEEHFSWGEAELMTCNRQALRAAFVDEATKSQIFERLEAV
jgi:adenosine deaminase